MSTHGLKAARRHPEPQRHERKRFAVAHVVFEVADHPENGCTFALKVGDPLTASERPPLFSGHIEPGMGTQLRRLAHHIDDLEAKFAKRSRAEKTEKQGRQP